MSGESDIDPNIDAALRRQEKFDAYVVGLVFTLLGLSVQTATFGASLVGDILELLGWVLLLLSGFAGLSRMEWMPEAFRLASYRVEREVRVRTIKVAALQGSHEVLVVPTGKRVAAAEYIAEDEKAISMISDGEANVEKKLNRRYLVFKWSFVLAVVFVVAARAWVPLTSVAARLSN